MAKQADGAALVRYGETVVLVTAVAAKDLKLDTDFFPLTVDYQEKTFAAGKIPGGFFKREGRPSEKEILTCRLIDRSIRPLFAEGLRCETQVIATVLSADRENDPDVVAMLGTSVALHVSDIPFNGPLAGVRIGRIDGQWVMNPTQSQLERERHRYFSFRQPGCHRHGRGRRARWCLRKRFSKLCLPAMKRFNHSCKYKRKFAGRSANRKGMCRSPNWTTRCARRVEDLALAKLRQALEVPEKLERYKRIAEVKSEVVPLALAEFPDKQKDIKGAFEELKRNVFRGLVIQKERRIDGRGLKDIRPITCETGGAAAHPRLGVIYARRNPGTW